MSSHFVRDSALFCIVLAFTSLGACRSSGPDEGGGRSGTGGEAGGGRGGDHSGRGGFGAAGVTGRGGASVGGVGGSGAIGGGVAGAGGGGGIDARGGAGGTGSGGATVNAEGPCDIYRDAGQPCVAAYSTVRRLLSTYAGPLYQNQERELGAEHRLGWPDARHRADDAWLRGRGRGGCSLCRHDLHRVAALRPVRQGKPSSSREGRHSGRRPLRRDGRLRVQRDRGIADRGRPQSLLTLHGAEAGVPAATGRGRHAARVRAPGHLHARRWHACGRWLLLRVR